MGNKEYKGLQQLYFIHLPHVPSSSYHDFLIILILPAYDTEIFIAECSVKSPLCGWLTIANTLTHQQENLRNRAKMASKQEFRIRDLSTRSVLIFPNRAQIVRDIRDVTLQVRCLRNFIID